MKKILLILLALLVSANVHAIERVSVDDLGAEANARAYAPSISSDGQYVAFHSTASNLVAGDTNGFYDVFVYDRNTDTIERVSVDDLGAEGNAESTDPSISSDGRYVAFRSSSSNLVAGDTNTREDIFVYDRNTDTIERVSVDDLGAEGDNHSYTPSISSDGQFVAFRSTATNLVTGDTNGFEDIFVYDRNTDTIERVSVDDLGAEGNQHSADPAISADGQFVAFQSHASNLVASDTNNRADIFVYDRNTDTIERVSVDDLGVEGIFHSYTPSISSDGRYVAFRSSATNLVPNDTNSREDVFVYDRNTDTIERVSVDDLGAEGNNNSYGPSISADGQYVVFYSNSTNLVASDTNAVEDIFAYNRTTNTIERISLDDLGAEGNSYSLDSVISADGEYIAFLSIADNLVTGDTNAVYDVFVTKTVKLVISEVTLITTPSTDTTPTYVFNTTVAGNITYGGACTSTTALATVGSNSITFDELAVGIYTDCTIQVSDGADTSNVLNIPDFTIEAPASSSSGGGGGGSRRTGSSNPFNSIDTTPTIQEAETTTQELITSLRAQIAVLEVQIAAALGNATNTVNTIIPVLGDGNLCSAEKILSENMHIGAEDGQYQYYNRGIVTEVLTLQQHLNRLGFSPEKFDGKFGPLTDTAVKQMQTVLGLVKIDGKIGPNTRAQINNSC